MTRPRGAGSKKSGRPASGNKWGRHAPKSRKGCKTCKKRHEKCDERRPSCTKCTSTGRVCDFVETNPLNFQISKGCLPGYAITVPSTASQELDYFRVVCTESFSGDIQNDLWDRIILQQSAAHTCIRHAVASVAAIHRHLAFPPKKGGSNDAASTYRDAFSKHAKAIELLNASLSNDQSGRELACVASILFMIFEVLSGNDTAAMLHLEAGFKILRTSSTQKLLNEPGILSDLLPCFSSIDNQASSFSVGYDTKALVEPAVPPIFTCIADASNVLKTIISRMNSYVEMQQNRFRILPHHPWPAQAKKVLDTWSSAFEEYKFRTLPGAPLPGDIALKVAEIKNLLSSWSLAFESYVSKKILLLTRRDHIGANILRISHQTAKIFISTCFNSHQISYDQYLSQFDNIVMLAASVLDSRKEMATNHGLPIRFDICIIQPLTFVALKCRDRRLRRRAIDILESAGREGVWDGPSTASILRWVVSKEEEHLYPTEHEVMFGSAVFGEEVPMESNRFHSMAIDFRRLERRVRILGKRKRGDLWEDLRGEAVCSGPPAGVHDRTFEDVEAVIG